MAHTLAKAWCHKRQFYLDLAQTSGVDDYEYTLADHEGYVEPEYFTEAVEGLEGKLLQRVSQIRGMRPGQCS